MAVGLTPAGRLAALALLGLGFAAGCGGPGGSEVGKEEEGAAPRPVTIGVSLLTRTHPFYQELEAGLREAAAEKGYTLIVQSGEFDVARQKEQIESFLVSQVSAIVLCPCDSRSIGTAVEAANEAGIPVFTADIAVLAERAKIVSHTASDNVEGGRLAARALREALGGKGKIAVVDHPEVESVIQRVSGFEEEIAREPGIDLVARLSGRGTKDGAMRTTEDILQAHPDLDGIFGINDDSALGALAAIEKARRQGRVVIVGFDAVAEAREAIREGRIYADVVQQPRTIGRETIGAIAAYLEGGAVAPARLIPCRLYTQAEARNGA